MKEELGGRCKRPALRFQKWSSKAYAMFASIGKHITIGNVKNSITNASMIKQGAKLIPTDRQIFFYGESREGGAQETRHVFFHNKRAIFASDCMIFSIHTMYIDKLMPDKDARAFLSGFFMYIGLKRKLC